VLGGIAAVLLLLVTIHILRHPWWLYCARTAIDVHSGDIARRTYVCDRKVRETIEETAFSREVRRLGIALPEGRYWRSAGGRYGYLIGDCRLVVLAMDELRMPDAERAVLLKEILTIIQAKDIDRRRLENIQTELGKQLRQLTERELNMRAEKRAAVAKKIKEHYQGSDHEFVVRGPLRLVTVEQELRQSHEESSRIKEKAYGTAVPFVDSATGKTYARFKNWYQRGDELYFFTSDPNSWNNLAGIRGYVLVRKNAIVDSVVTGIN
jgi:hypothetical protein